MFHIGGISNLFSLGGYQELVTLPQYGPPYGGCVSVADTELSYAVLVSEAKTLTIVTVNGSMVHSSAITLQVNHDYHDLVITGLAVLSAQGPLLALSSYTVSGLMEQFYAQLDPTTGVMQFITAIPNGYFPSPGTNLLYDTSARTVYTWAVVNGNDEDPIMLSYSLDTQSFFSWAIPEFVFTSSADLSNKIIYAITSAPGDQYQLMSLSIPSNTPDKENVTATVIGALDALNSYIAPDASFYDPTLKVLYTIPAASEGVNESPLFAFSVIDGSVALNMTSMFSGLLSISGLSN